MAETEQSPLLRYLVNNPDAFATNLARAIEKAGKAAAAYLKPREAGEMDFVPTDEKIGRAHV